MEAYHKITTVWTRDSETKYKTLIEGQWATPELKYLRDNVWSWSEKVDGTNIRVWYEDSDDCCEVRFGGRTDSAQIPAFLFARLQDLFTAGPGLAKVFEPPVAVTMFGEGYGAKIRKGGGLYIPGGVDFILFDVMIGGHFLKREDVEDIAAKLGIDVVPIVGEGTLLEAIEFVRSKPMSTIGTHEMEGL